MLNRVSAQEVSPRTKTRLRSDTVSSNCANENITCSMAGQRRLQVRLPVNKRSLNENNPWLTMLGYLWWRTSSVDASYLWSRSHVSTQDHARILKSKVNRDIFLTRGTLRQLQSSSNTSINSLSSHRGVYRIARWCGVTSTLPRSWRSNDSFAHDVSQK